MKKLLSLSLVMAAAVSFAAEPKEEITSAAKKLADQPNYGWISTPTSGDGSNVPTGTTEGKTEKGGFTYFSLTVNSNPVEAAFKGDKSAINMEGSWVGVDEISSDREWVATRLRSFKPPAQEVLALLKEVTDLKKTGEGAYEGKLSPEGVKEAFAFRSNQATISNSKGVARFWTKDGQLSKYELKVEADVEFQGQSRSVNRTTTVEIKDVGSAKVEVPQEAKAKL